MTAKPAVPARLRDILSLDDFEEAARRHLPRPVFAYLSGGVEDNTAREDNRAVFREWSFVPRVLKGVAKRAQATTLLGHEYAAPFGIAPIGVAALYAYRGDLVLATAARAANIPFAMSGSSLIRLEDVAAAAPDSWFQAYLTGDEARFVPLIERIAAAGYRTLVVTVDVPMAGNRENNVRAGFSTPLRPTLRLAWDGMVRPRWTVGTFMRTMLQHGMPHFENNFATRGAPILSPNVLRDYSDRGDLDWDHFSKIRAMWKGRVVVKGVLDSRDARIAVDRGADALIVSNHGGRQLDGSIAPLRVLPEIVAACPQVPVMIDSGIRRGTDILKALALGAKFVFLGRSFGYAASVGGEAGVLRAIDILRVEIDRDMAMMGINRLDELTPEMLRRIRP